MQHVSVLLPYGVRSMHMDSFSIYFFNGIVGFKVLALTLILDSDYKLLEEDEEKDRAVDALMARKKTMFAAAVTAVFP